MSENLKRRAARLRRPSCEIGGRIVDLGTYHGLHVVPVQAEFEKVEWGGETFRTGRARVREYTCACQDVVYELCAAGGLMFVRRLDSSAGDPAVMESAWLVTREAERLWGALLAGLAR